ncbi:hypothetical protein ACP275_06G015800 [Erythranthe tilingii]
MLWRIETMIQNKEATTGSMIYSYRHGFSGFAAKMTRSQAKFIQGLSGVVQVFPNRIYKLHTTRSWDYLGLSTYSTINLLHHTNQGSDAIIGVFDTGVWPESESFNDKGIGPIPPKWKGFCQSGHLFNASRHCNKKLIGARYFIDGFLASIGEPFNATENNEFISPRDSDGHGTHCASTAGGSPVSNVSYGGLARGTARGGAPRARLAVYKVGWLGGVVSPYIHDGVDVLSISLGIDLPLYPEVDKRDVIYYGSFHAVANGVTVVCSAGNSGPGYQTVEDVAPWVVTVATSTIDRSYPTPIMLGNNQTFAGQSMYVGKDTGYVELFFYSEREPISAQQYCEDITANDTQVAGKVVICFTATGTENSILRAAAIVRMIGGLGLIATKKTFQATSTYYSPSFPCVLVTYDVGSQIVAYFRSTKSVYRYIYVDPKVRLKPTKTYIGKQVSSYIASFSSRGPNSLSPSVLKHQESDILGAYVPTTSNPSGYFFESGTSMAARSKKTIAAWTTDPHSGEPIFAKGDIPKIADPFDYGGGLVNPNAARNPGLVYDMGTQDYVNYLCAMDYTKSAIGQLTGQTKPCLKSGNSILDVNLPSITVPNLKEPVTITRTVTNVGDRDSKYRAVVVPPQGIVVKVNPTYLVFNAKVKKTSFTVTITTLHKAGTEYFFGSLTWTDEVQEVKIPISVRTEFPQVYGD